MRQGSGSSVEDQVNLIDIKQGAGKLEIVSHIVKPSQDSSWLDVNQSQIAPCKEMTAPPPPSKKKKADRNEMENRILSQRSAGKGYLQNRQMGETGKKIWDTDIAYIRNLFAYLVVWLNPIRIEAKVGMFAHQNLCKWIYFLWDTMMPRAINDFIWSEEVRRKLEWDIKENPALNLVHDFLSNGHLDLQMQKLIRINHTFYRFIFSTVTNIIYHSTKEVQTQDHFVSAFNEWQSRAQGGWLAPPVNPYNFQTAPAPLPPPQPEIPQYAPYPIEKNRPAPLSEKEKAEILKRKILDQQKKELEHKLEEMNERKRKLKDFEKMNKTLNKKLRNMM